MAVIDTLEDLPWKNELVPRQETFYLKQMRDLVTADLAIAVCMMERWTAVGWKQVCSMHDLAAVGLRRSLVHEEGQAGAGGRDLEGCDFALRSQTSTCPGEMAEG